jgi:hypothetical protein
MGLDKTGKSGHGAQGDLPVGQSFPQAINGGVVVHPFPNDVHACLFFEMRFYQPIMSLTGWTQTYFVTRCLVGVTAVGAAGEIWTRW